MPKLTEYPEAQSFDENDTLIKDGVNGTKKIKASNAADYMGKNVIMVNEDPTPGTKVVLETTDEEYELALMSDVNSVAEEVDDVKTQLKEIYDGDYKSVLKLTASIPFGNYQVGDVVDITPLSQTGTVYTALIPDILEKETFFINAVSGTIAKPWAFLDKDYKLLLMSSGAYATNETITAPANAKYLVVQVGSVDPAYYTNAKIVRELALENISKRIDKINSLVYVNASMRGWIKGIPDASGIVTTSSNGAVSPSNVYSIDSIITILDGARAVMGFYGANNNYIGKVGANGDVNKTSGDWKYFTGLVNPQDFATNDSVYARITLIPTDGTAITVDTVDSYVLTHCLVNTPAKNEMATHNELTDYVDNYVKNYCKGKMAYIAPAYSNANKINIQDSKIIIPTFTRVLYGNSVFRTISAIEITRTAETSGTTSEEVIIFDSSDNTFKSYAGVNYNPTDTEYVLFMCGNGLSWCSLSPSQYTYDGNPAYMSYSPKTDILNLNNEPLLTEKIIETRYCGANNKENLTIIHFSDIHGSTTNIERLLEIKEKYTSYIDDIIHTGDSVLTYYADANPFSTIGGDSVLNVIGNHDCWIQGDTWPHPYNVTSQQAYEKFISPYISNWGVTSAGANLCYYYKDYSAYNIRLIVLDALHYDSGQETWFTNTLNSVPDGYSVIVANHYPPQSGITAFDCTFTSYGITVDPVADPTAGAQIERLSESAYTVVDNYINGGGKFICWMAGHTHYDYVGKVTGHLNQIVVLINCGVVDARYGTDKRVNGTKTQDCMNVIGFDTTNKLIKICRVGISQDWFGREKNLLSVNYDTKQIVANT